MIAGVQAAGIGVVMDVVYNHSVPSEGAGSAFWQTVPNYYFRTNDKGSSSTSRGLGNALNDERPMVRKFIRDSLVFGREYGVAGFRFDLIGMFTKESIADWASAIRAVNPWALIYGEPWTGGGPTRFGKGDQKGTGVAVFNDFFRGAVQRNDDASPGFAMGNVPSARDVLLGLAGSGGFPQPNGGVADHPSETINYVSASHDNLTLRDKIARAVPDADKATIDKMVNLAHALVMLSEGSVRIEGGAEMGRTKGESLNSYNAGDEVNAFRWDLAPQFEDTHDSERVDLHVRKSHLS
ncbi:MAG: hypothetical protein R2688_01255 [Fimbriimonadaceae bacterium]